MKQEKKYYEMIGFNHESVTFAQGTKKAGDALVTVVLSIHEDGCDEECKKNMFLNNAVMYEQGIFRIESLWNDRENNKKKMIQIFGHFSEKDPNGLIHNGWKDEELEDKEAIEVGTIDSLEV